MSKHKAVPYENAQVCRIFLQNFTGIAYRQTSDGQLPIFNGEVEGILGSLERPILTLEDWVDNVHPEDRPFLLSSRTRLAARAGAERLEYRIQTGQGATKWVSDLAKSQADGSGVYIEGVIYDISDQKEAEAAIQILIESIIGRSGQDCLDYTVTEIINWLTMDMALLLELTPTGCLRLLASSSPAGDWPELLNPAGSLAEYLMGQGPALIPEGVAERFSKPFGPRGKSIQACLGAPLRGDSGEIIGLLCGLSQRPLSWTNPLWLHMISLVAAKASTVLMERQRTLHLTRAKEKAEAESRAKSDFLAKTGQDLRSLLESLQGSLRLIQESPLNKGQKDLAGLSMRSAESLAALVNNLLDTSEPESGGQEVCYGEITFRELIGSVEETLACDRRTCNISLSWDIAPATPEAFITDPKRLKQLLTNALAEAVVKIDHSSFTIGFTFKIANYQYNFPFNLEIFIVDNLLDPLSDDAVRADPKTTFFVSRRLVDVLGGEFEFLQNAEGRPEIRLRVPVSIPQALLS